MIRLNENYLKLEPSYLFIDIAKRVSEFQKQHPEREVIKMGIGDVTQPLPEACREGFHKGIDDLGRLETFRGYGPEQGYDFLREKIAENDFQSRGADISPDEIFVSDGSKCDSGNIQELFSPDTRIAVQDPVYPVYVDTNVMAGRTGNFTNGRYEGLTYLESLPENNYSPSLPSEPVDLIYLCYPNNPTGTVISKEQLTEWVAYAKEHKSLILFDAAYASFIRDESIPQSIFEIPGAKEVAIEFRSFSKNAGFTGTRCAYIVIPKECMAHTEDGSAHPLHGFWNRRHTTKFNGVSYPVQRAAEATYSEQGKEQTRALTDYYLANAHMIREGISSLGYQCVGGEHSPYVWINAGQDSWQMFDELLNKAGVVCTPGVGFGRSGEGHIRLSAFNTKENTEKALANISNALTS